jgi:AbrB family looped-hinge helix DNA binding protein
MIKVRSTTKLSSKGQVVIPEEIRQNLKLRAGDLFLVYGKDDTIVLRAAPVPTDDEFETIVSEAQTYAREAKLKPSDIQKAIKKIRGRK